MIRQAELVRFDRVATSGRTQPLLVEVETQDGQRHEAFLKLAGRNGLTPQSLFHEYLGAHLGQELGVPLCEPFLVTCDPDFLRLLAAQHSALAALAANQFPAFGSKNAGKQWKAWGAGDLISEGRKQAALSTFCFDALFDNADRRATNPNLLVKGDQLRAIDHEMAFAFTQLIDGGQPPWELGGLNWLTQGDRRHCLYGALLKTQNLPFKAVRKRWTELTHFDRTAALENCPENWRPASHLADKIFNRVDDILTNLDNCISEIERVLA